MASFDHGRAGMVSLRAVNEWIGVINANLGGTNRTAYKGTKVSFGGGVAQVSRDPRTAINGIMTPDSTLKVSHTSIDFGQGTIIQDGELTHMAISGDGFFAVHDGNACFYTRDGEFRWSVLNSATILTTAGGLTVMDASGAAPITRSGTGATFSVTISTTFGADNCVGVFRFDNNQSLKFSKYGSTVFDATNYNAAGGVITQITDVELIQSGLEGSNAALNDTLPELSLAQKMFSAVSKIINVHNTNLDTVVNLIR